MKRFSVLLRVLLFFNFFSVSKVYSVVIKGLVINKESKEILPFATICIKNKSIGVVANENGLFEFHIGKEYNNDTLIVSMLGYKIFELPLHKLKPDSSTIKFEMEQTATVLKAIEINAITAPEIMQNIRRSYKINYTTKPFLTEDFFRMTFQENGDFVHVLEASVDSYDKGFDLKKETWKMPEFFIKQIRASQSNGIIPTVTHQNALKEILSCTHLYISGLLLDNHFIFQLKETVFEGNTKYYVLSFAAKNEYNVTEGELVVNANTWSIKEIHRNWLNKKKFNDPRKIDSLFQDFTSESFLVQYKEYAGKMYLSYIKHHSNFDAYTQSRSTDVKYVTTFELSVNRIQTENIDKPKGSRMRMNKGLFVQSNDYPYNADHWKNFNMILENVELAKMRADLAKKGVWDEQFKNFKKLNRRD
jgi:hypothetical protein